MPIARNRRSEPDPAKIAAFGAAAEARVEVPVSPPATPALPQRATDATPTRHRGDRASEPPKSSIVRWTGSTGDEELRDRLLAYSRRERYAMQELMIRALRIGLDEIEKQ